MTSAGCTCGRNANPYEHDDVSLEFFIQSFTMFGAILSMCVYLMMVLVYVSFPLFDFA